MAPPSPPVTSPLTASQEQNLEGVVPTSTSGSPVALIVAAVGITLLVFAVIGVAVFCRRNRQPSTKEIEARTATFEIQLHEKSMTQHIHMELEDIGSPGLQVDDFDTGDLRIDDDTKGCCSPTSATVKRVGSFSRTKQLKSASTATKAVDETSKVAGGMSTSGRQALERARSSSKAKGQMVRSNSWGRVSIRTRKPSAVKSRPNLEEVATSMDAVSSCVPLEMIEVKLEDGKRTPQASPRPRKSSQSMAPDVAWTEDQPSYESNYKDLPESARVATPATDGPLSETSSSSPPEVESPPDRRPPLLGGMGGMGMGMSISERLEALSAKLDAKTNDRRLQNSQSSLGLQTSSPRKGGAAPPSTDEAAPRLQGSRSSLELTTRASTTGAAASKPEEALAGAPLAARRISVKKISINEPGIAGPTSASPTIDDRV